MARRSRVEINRAALDEVMAGLADGMFDVGKAIVEEASKRAPDSPEQPWPLGRGLPQQGGVIVFVNGKRVHEHSLRPDKRPDKPGATKVRRYTIVGIVGFGFPAQFVEFGTLRARARPFLTPAVASVIGAEARFLLSNAMHRRLAGQRSRKTFEIREKIAASRAARSGA